MVEVEGAQGPERLVMAAALLETALQGPYDVVTTLRGSDLVGLRYQPLYDPQLAGVEVRRFQKRPADGPGPVGAPEPTDRSTTGRSAPTSCPLDDGTGIVHIAPAFGDEDLSAGREHGLASSSRWTSRASSPAATPSPASS